MPSLDAASLPTTPLLQIIPPFHDSGQQNYHQGRCLLTPALGLALASSASVGGAILLFGRRGGAPRSDGPSGSPPVVWLRGRLAGQLSERHLSQTSRCSGCLIVGKLNLSFHPHHSSRQQNAPCAESIVFWPVSDYPRRLNRHFSSNNSNNSNNGTKEARSAGQSADQSAQPAKEAPEEFLEATKQRGAPVTLNLKPLQDPRHYNQHNQQSNTSVTAITSSSTSTQAYLAKRVCPQGRAFLHARSPFRTA